MFQRILLALDAGEAGPVASSFAIALARAGGSRVHVVHVSEYVCCARSVGGGRPDEATGIVADALRAMHDQCISATGVTYRTSRFDAATAIATVAQQWRADVIVVGSRRRRRLNVLRRPMRDRIARASPLPVLAAPAPLRIGRRPGTPDDVPVLPNAITRS